MGHQTATIQSARADCSQSQPGSGSTLCPTAAASRLAHPGVSGNDPAGSDSAIAVERDNAEHYAARAWQLNEIGQPVLALADAQMAVQLEADSASGRVEESYALTKLGQTEEAFSQIKKATELNADLAPAWQYRGRHWRWLRGINLAAVDSFHALFALNKSSPA